MPEKATSRPGRNEPCHCGSKKKKKYKHCCLAKDEAADRKAREKAAAAKPAKPAKEAAAAAADRAPEAPQRKPPRHGTDQPWKRGTAQNTRGFHKFTGPRKVGSG